jgi:hypothetical protein
MQNVSPAKAGFVVSVAILAFLYGFVTRANQWAPTGFLQQVQQEASNIWYQASLTTRIYDRQGVGVEQPDEMQPGLTLINSYWEYSNEWAPGLKLIDRHGETAHSWRIDREALFPEAVDRRGDPNQRNVHGSYLFPNGDLLVNVGYVGTARVDVCGEVQWRLPAGTHHSIERAADGSFWIPGVSKRPRLTTERYPDGLPGLEQPIWIDQIHRVSEKGIILGTTDLPDLLYQNDLERYFAKYESRHNTDITHLNDVEPLSPAMAEDYPLFEGGDLLVSVRNLDLVFVYDPSTGQVRWHASEPFIQQHDPDFIGNGWIGVFDNNRDFTGRGTLTGGSRIVAVQPHTDSTVVRFPTDQSDPFYTDTMGKWQHLNNGNLLLAETKAGRAVEITPDGRTAWEVVRTPYNNSKVPRVPGAARVDLTREDVSDWPCSPTGARTSRQSPN